MEMQTVLALVVVFTGTTHGVETTCNAAQHVSCYGTLGQPLYLQLMTNTIQYDINLDRKTNDDKDGILRIKDDKMYFFNTAYSSLIKQRVYYSSHNGTLIINPVERNDSGTYIVQIVNNTGGNKVVNNTLQLIINDTHMTPNISNTKHPPLHNDTQLVSNGTWKMSNIMVVSGSSAVFVLCLAVSGGIFYIKRRKNTYRAAEPEDVVYADVSKKREKKRSKLKERGEPTVEYGEVNLTDMSHTRFPS